MRCHAGGVEGESKVKNVRTCKLLMACPRVNLVIHWSVR